jgi:glyoxylase-like metal-dependent hydrolase (beta-lactamase superfamily II)
MVRTGVEVAGGVWQFQSPLWQTNCLLARTGGEVLLCDPSFAPEELEELRAEVARESVSRVYLLVTHADYDHVCAIGTFPEATVVAGPATAAAIASGRAGAELAAAGEEWGFAWPGQLRVDAIAEAGSRQRLGAFTVETIDSPSHGREGLGYVLLEHGVLFPGDHLSPITIPLLAGSLDRAIEANERLLDALESHPVQVVVPGHGRALGPDEARTIGEADLAYLRELRGAASDAVSSGASPGWALLRAYAVEPPRPSTDDFEIYGIRASNARLALEQAKGGRE